MGKHRTLDPALARVVETLADLMAERDVRRLGSLRHADDSLRPLFERPAEPPLYR